MMDFHKANQNQKQTLAKRAIHLLFLPLLFSGFMVSEAQAQSDGTLPSCFRTSGGGTVANIDQLTVGDLCIDGDKIKKLYKKCVGSDATAWIDFHRCIKNASNKDIAAHLGTSASNVCANDASSGGTGGCANTGNSGSVNNGGANFGGSGGRASNNGNGDIDLSNGPSNGGPGSGGGRINVNGGGGFGGSGNSGGSRSGGSGDVRVNAQTDLNILANHCGDDGDLNDYDTKHDADARTQALDDLARAQCSGDYNTDDCVKIKDLQKAMTDTLNACHTGCVSLATNADSACYWDKLKGVSIKAFKTEADFCGALASNDNATPSVADFMKGSGVGDQNLCSSYANSSSTSNKVCTAMLADKSCAQVMKGDDSGSSDFQCDGFQDAAQAYYKKKADIAAANAKIKQLDGSDTAGICSIANASDASKAAAKKDEVSIKCVTKMAATCEAALEKTQARVDAMIANCATCNGRGGNGGGNSGAGAAIGVDARSSSGNGISKWAQIISAATPLVSGVAGGVFNMMEYNKCQSTNASIASQQITLYQNVGLTGPVTTGSCSGMGGGYGGYGGTSGMSGIGGYSPYGNLGGMSSTGIGAGGYSPYGSSTGLSGLSGLGSMSGSLGLSSYNPYSAYSSMNQYGLSGVSGINSSLYGGNAYQSQQNMSSVFSQMQQQNSLFGGSGTSAYGLSSYNPYSSYGSLYGSLYGSYPSSAYSTASNPYASLYGNVGLTTGSTCGYYTTGIPCSGY